MSTINATIVTEARKFLNTPFHLQGRKIGVGIDCIGLIIAVANNLNIKSKCGLPLKYYDYFQYDLKPLNLDLVLLMEKHFDQCEVIHIGSIALFENNSNYHLGIIGDYRNNFSLIHACINTNKVVEHRLDASLKHKIIQLYKFHIN
jgi:hypothetical protein